MADARRLSREGETEMLRTTTLNRIFGAIAVGVVCIGCIEECTEMDCGPIGLEITISQSDGEPLVSAVYDFVIEADGVRYTASCNPFADPAAACAVSPPVDSTVNVSLQGTGNGTVLITTFTRSGDDFVAPQTVVLEVFRDGESVGAEIYTPEYDREFPNGEGCGFCDHAAETLVIDAPEAGGAYR